MIVACMVPIRLVGSTSTQKEIIFCQTSRASSPRFCRPIHTYSMWEWNHRKKQTRNDPSRGRNSRFNCYFYRNMCWNFGNFPWIVFYYNWWKNMRRRKWHFFNSRGATFVNKHQVNLIAYKHRVRQPSAKTYVFVLIFRFFMDGSECSNAYAICLICT